MSRNGFLIVLFIAFVSAGRAQEHVTRNILWVAAQEQLRFGKHWFAGADIQVRRDEWGKRQMLWAVRPGVGYSFSPAFQAGTGVALFAATSARTGVVTYERRVWQDLNYQLSKEKTTVFFRLRTEQRFFPVTGESRFQHIFRIRLRGEIVYPLHTVYPGLQVMAGNEFLFYFAGKNGLFDQNRLYAGPSWKRKQTETGLQYLLIYQRRRDGVTESQHIIRLVLRHTLHFTKHKQPRSVQ